MSHHTVQHLEVNITDSYEHCLLTIKFAADARDTVLRRDACTPDAHAPLGIKYHYTLREEAQGQEAVDAPEWMLPLPELQRLALEVGLELDMALNFHEYYEAMQYGTCVVQCMCIQCMYVT
jgi:mRNA capping enzyme